MSSFIFMNGESKLEYIFFVTKLACDILPNTLLDESDAYLIVGSQPQAVMFPRLQAAVTA